MYLKLIVGLVLFLTFENLLSGQAIYSNRYSTFYVSGPGSILVNLGILGLALWAISYIMYLFNRKTSLLRTGELLVSTGTILIIVGIVWEQI